jgi:hypothetical protein
MDVVEECTARLRGLLREISRRVLLVCEITIILLFVLNNAQNSDACHLPVQ